MEIGDVIFKRRDRRSANWSSWHQVEGAHGAFGYSEDSEIPSRKRVGNWCDIKARYGVKDLFRTESVVGNRPTVVTPHRGRRIDRNRVVRFDRQNGKIPRIVPRLRRIGNSCRHEHLPIASSAGESQALNSSFPRPDLLPHGGTHSRRTGAVNSCPDGMMVSSHTAGQDF